MMLRAVHPDDLPFFFEHQKDPVAAQLAACIPREPAAFLAHWHDHVLGNPDTLVRTIVWDGQVAGNIESWNLQGRRLVGYWIGREFWGKGLATRALAGFVELDAVRPLHAWVATHNVASKRVLEKCGFLTVTGSEHVGEDGVAEVLFELS